MIRFSKNYSKLDIEAFTTIRKASPYYRIYSINKIKAPTKEFTAQIIEKEGIRKQDISDDLAHSDADCSRDELITMLEEWYGKEFDDFVLLTLERK